MPVAVIPRPPNICVASSAVSRPVFVTNLRNAVKCQILHVQAILRQNILLEKTDSTRQLVGLLVVRHLQTLREQRHPVRE